MFCAVRLFAVATTYTNPVLPGTTPDPSIVRVGENYYLTTSSFGYFPGSPIFHSRDLVNWKQIANALDRRRQLDLAGVPVTGGIWAPTLRHHDGKFYLVTTNMKNPVGGGIWTSGQNFFITATNPAGPWSEPTMIDVGGFDPDLFWDTDGTAYYTRRENNTIVQARIDLATGKLLEPLRQIAGEWVGGGTEAPHIYKVGDWYYLICAEGGTAMMHMVTVARSRTPSGPFEPAPRNPILAQHRTSSPQLYATGHADLVQAPDGSWWGVYLAKRSGGEGFFAHLGRETHLMPVNWRDGWPIFGDDGHALLKVTAKMPHPIAAREKINERDEFNAERLGLPWVVLGDLPDAAWSLTAKPGVLRLRGGMATLDSTGTPTLVARRLAHLKFEAATAISFSPTTEKEEAGLALFTAPSAHYALVVTRRNGAEGVALIRKVDDLRTEYFQATKSVVVELSVQGEPTRLRFFAKLADGTQLDFGSAKTRFLGDEIPRVWTGCMIGMYSTGGEKPAPVPADFDWFSYAERE